VTVVLLDSNALIDLDQAENEHADDLQRVIELARAGEFELATSAVSASENPRGDAPRTFEQFTGLLDRIGLSDVRILKSMGYWGESYWGEALWADEDGQRLERQIHQVLAPDLDFDDRSNERRWRNVKCDVLLVWAFIHHGVDILLTNDARIVKKASQLAELGAGRISTPQQFLQAR
jgi:hypothetical protein